MAPGNAFAPLITNTPKRLPPPAEVTPPPDAFLRSKNYAGARVEPDAELRVPSLAALGELLDPLAPAVAGSYEEGGGEQSCAVGSGGPKAPSALGSCPATYPSDKSSPNFSRTRSKTGQPPLGCGG